MTKLESAHMFLSFPVRILGAEKRRRRGRDARRYPNRERNLKEEPILLAAGPQEAKRGRFAHVLQSLSCAERINHSSFSLSSTI